MVPYFPETYPDELLYSVLARYHRHMCHEDPKQTLDDLFGSRRLQTAHDLPGHLRALAAKLPPERGLSAERLAADLTLYPYYVAFAPASVRAKVLDTLLDSPAKDVHLRLGCASATIAPPSTFRYCPACNADMEERYGERYWRRAHQLPGALVCTEHAVPLAESTVSGWIGHRREFHACTVETCPTNKPLPSWADDARCIALLLDIAARSAALLGLPSGGEAPDTAAARYREALAARGLMNSPRRTDQTRLADSFAAFSTPLRAALPITTAPDWLVAMTRKHRRSFHPLQHVLFEAFLDHVPVLSKPRPFGAGPWPCLNPLAEHHCQAVVTDLSIRFDRGRTIGRFSCACGYVYTRRGLADAPPRLVSRGPAFDRHLRDLTFAGTSLSDTSRVLRVAPCTVERHARRLGLPMPWKGKEDARTSDPGVRETIRGRWLLERREFPALSRKDLAKRLPAEHAWLYRHDRAWLAAQSPRCGPRRFVPERADWTITDRELAAALPGMAAVIADLEPPRRVTITILKRQVGLPSWIDRHRDKLPATMSALDKVVETVEVFQLRRIARIILRHGCSTPRPPPWKVRQLAGLPQQPLPAVAAAIAAFCTPPEEVLTWS